MTRPTGQTLAELLHTGVIQLGHRTQRILQTGVRGPNDLAMLADYLRELAEHGHNVAHLALDAIDEGGDVEVYLGNAQALMEVTQTLAADSYALLSKKVRHAGDNAVTYAD